MKIANLITVAALSSTLLYTLPSNAGTLSPEDATIVSDIHSKYTAEKSTADLKVDVTSHGGLVELSGKVNTGAEAEKLIEIAESTAGVKDVTTTHLSVKESKHPMKDSAITAKVKGTFIREKLFGDKDIDVMGVKIVTTNGTVYLTGTVDSKEEAANAEKLAKSVKGVKKLDSKLEVKAE